MGLYLRYTPGDRGKKLHRRDEAFHPCNVIVFGAFPSFHSGQPACSDAFLRYKVRMQNAQRRVKENRQYSRNAN
ncbi:hypothetical protein AKJ16_DCAP22425, partial [Drosera capensis]